MKFDSIISNDGKTIYHGTILNWMKDDEFTFAAIGGSISNPMWIKLDAWKLIKQ